MNSNYDHLLKILLIGDVNAGKSSMMIRLSQGLFKKPPLKLIGVDFMVRMINLDDKVVKAQIWDTYTVEKFKNVTTGYYRGAHGIMLFYNIDDRRSFANLQHWYAHIMKTTDENVIKILIGNKCDLGKLRQVSYDEGKAYADDVGMQFFETSVKTGENTEEALCWIVGEIMKKIESEEQRQTVKGKDEDNKANSRKQTEEKQSRWRELFAQIHSTFLCKRRKLNLK